MSVDRLHPAIIHHVVNSLGWPSLRDLQEQAIAPILDGDDALLIAPTAGGKTEAAAFPVLSAAVEGRWSGLSVLYLCPLRALLNNLEPRLNSYAQWVGRRVGLWHGDTADSRRRHTLADPPDILLTTPESLEAMLVSTRVKPRELFAELRVVVVDEVHAFAGDDRGWHLLAVLERLQRLAGRPLQRIGLSATVGNPDVLLHWLQGSGAAVRPATVIAPDAEGDRSRPVSEVTLDHVGSVANAAKVISLLHAGEKRLVFCESRRTVEELALALRTHGVETFVSHSSLSVDERRRAEQAFAEARDCVIVATSTLELGIDVGDLDRMIQVDAPNRVASFLQRLGRTGRRTGVSRNALFLTVSEDSLLKAAGLLQLWSRGYVEPIIAPPAPRHITAQQILALCLQEGRVGRNTWAEWLDGLALVDETGTAIADWLVQSRHLEEDSGMLFIGQETERRFGRRHFLDLLSVFTAAPEIIVMYGREEIGSIDPLVLTRKVSGARVVALAGQSWKVTHVDWKRRRCFVEPSDASVRMRWSSSGSSSLSFELCRAERDVLLGADPEVALSKRAVATLRELREDRRQTVTPGATVILRDDMVWWWTWAGARANATISRALHSVADPGSGHDDHRIALRPDVSSWDVAAAVADAPGLETIVPAVSEDGPSGLKFSEVLPPGLAEDTLARRIGDPTNAAHVLSEPRQWLHTP